MRRTMGLALMLAGIGTGRAEVSCFRTVAQAAVQVGEQEGGGYRLEFVRADAFGRRRWASVRSCVHPEWPAAVVQTGVQAAKTAAAEETTRAAEPMVVRAGDRVRVVESDAVSRLEMAGVAQASGRVGDRLAVRILAAGDGGEELVVEAVVRGAKLLEAGR